MNIVIASNNTKKRREITLILSAFGIEVVSADATVFVDVEEDGETFADNARKKAEAFAQANRQPALADDSGLCVDGLGSEPGVHSSRFAGEEASDAENNTKLLTLMQNIENRAAHFVCALHLAFPDERAAIQAQGRVDGVILPDPDGGQGFGYDPLFYSTELGKSFASASADEKSRVSHRGRALREFASRMRSIV